MARIDVSCRTKRSWIVRLGSVVAILLSLVDTCFIQILTHFDDRFVSVYVS